MRVFIFFIIRPRRCRGTGEILAKPLFLPSYGAQVRLIKLRLNNTTENAFSGSEGAQIIPPAQRPYLGS